MVTRKNSGSLEGLLSDADEQGQYNLMHISEGKFGDKFWSKLIDGKDDKEKL